MTDGLPTFDPEIVDNNHHNTGDDGEMQIDPEVSLGGDEDGHPEGMDAEHPANPATYPIPPKPVLTETVKLGLEERAEKGRLLGEELKAIKELEARRAKINADITARRKQVDLLTIAVTTGTIEVPVGQEDIFRQPVGREAAASAFDEMAQEAAQAAGEDPQGLNAMAEGIQAAQGIEAPGPGFQNDIEDFKAKTAAKRKGKR